MHSDLETTPLNQPHEQHLTTCQSNDWTIPFSWPIRSVKDVPALKMAEIVVCYEKLTKNVKDIPQTIDEWLAAGPLKFISVNSFVSVLF